MVHCVCAVVWTRAGLEVPAGKPSEAGGPKNPSGKPRQQNGKWSPPPPSFLFEQEAKGKGQYSNVKSTWNRKCGSYAMWCRCTLQLCIDYLFLSFHLILGMRRSAGADDTAGIHACCQKFPDSFPHGMVPSVDVRSPKRPKETVIHMSLDEPVGIGNFEFTLSRLAER